MRVAGWPSWANDVAIDATTCPEPGGAETADGVLGVACVGEDLAPGTTLRVTYRAPEALSAGDLRAAAEALGADLATAPVSVALP